MQSCLCIKSQHIWFEDHRRLAIEFWNTFSELEIDSIFDNDKKSVLYVSKIHTTLGPKFSNTELKGGILSILHSVKSLAQSETFVLI